MDNRVDEYISNNNNWHNELMQLRAILLQLPLEETFKWQFPTYTYKGKNIVGMAAFKNYFGLWFFQGGLLKDEAKVLQNAQEGKTKAMRQWRFFTSDEINDELIKLYVLESIDNFEKGNVIKPKKNTKPLLIPDELKLELDKNEKLNFKFNVFSLSKKREFAEYISSAKREATKQSRLLKIIPMILEGVGLNDKYRKC